MLRPKSYRLLTEAIETGLRFGLKDGELLSDEARECLLDTCTTEILAAIGERFHIVDEYKE